VEVVFRSVPDWTVREFLVQLLRRIPVKTYWEESLADLVQRVKIVTIW
jgi:hypothetical protein